MYSCTRFAHSCTYTHICGRQRSARPGPALAVCGHLGFEGPPEALLDAARPRPTESSDRLCCWPSAAGKAASSEDLPAVAGPSPATALPKARV